VFTTENSSKTGRQGGERKNKIHNIGRQDEEININIKNVRMKKGEKQKNKEQKKNGGNLYGCY